MLGSTLALRSAFAPAALRHRAETSLAWKPRDGPRKVTACLMVVDIIVGVIFFHLLLSATDESGVFGPALARRRLVTMRTRDFTGQSSWSPLQARPITSPVTPFFCSSKVREAKVAQLSWASVAVSRSRRISPRNSWTLFKSKGWVSLGGGGGGPVY